MKKITKISPLKIFNDAYAARVKKFNDGGSTVGVINNYNSPKPKYGKPGTSYMATTPAPAFKPGGVTKPIPPAPVKAPVIVTEPFKNKPYPGLYGKNPETGKEEQVYFTRTGAKTYSPTSKKGGATKSKKK